ncbi:MAG TPA: dihydroorotate dehydrogenase [Deltaproteobacteria bacterium]|nr:dihydroorotate dehydrogenase [Deltaproteobacteria bacterium]HPR53518.1 dihydroorotate dehydrogenase [Deltaproteobacteria bacterium]HXK46145.1 dihydroorotate dehydrogenase [Deltaproteobacteria bacterium]
MDTSARITPDLILKNPVMSASGTFAYGEEFAEFFDLALLGAVVTKGLSLAPKTGNPTPRIVETACGMINSIGLENIGIPGFIKDKLPFLMQFDTCVITNFFGSTEDDYVRAAEALNVHGVSALEMNVSCPNVKQGGIEFGRDPDALHTLVKRVRQVCGKPLIVKLSPMVTDIRMNALAAEEAGADALTCINTVPAMAIDEKVRRPMLGNITGGLSGPAIKPIALKIVWDVSREVSIPVIASGGVLTAQDAIQFMLAGATAVQVGSGGLRDPLCYPEIIKGISTYLDENQIQDISDLIGGLLTD